jgi:aspartate--ammonia ligase
VERPVEFDLLEQPGIAVQVVQSLAKWKRFALGRYGYPVGRGLYTDMNAIRRDETTDNVHSIYVDQWDWEKVITPGQVNLQYLKSTVRRIYEAIKVTENKLYVEFPQIEPMLPEDIFFIHAEELLRMYPGLSPKERENAVAKEHKAVFVIGIGGKLSDGMPHDGRSADYDDWTTVNDEGYEGLNGDLLLWNPVLEMAFEVSSMGIRVDAETLKKQLEISGCEDRASLPFHKALLENKLPLTMGGGIGQSRMCMFFLRKAHIGEVQSSHWPKEDLEICRQKGVHLL